MAFSPPNLRHLRAFAVVAETKSVTKAAELIFLSQPTITQAINKLESTFGSELFERVNNGMFTTQAGNLLFDRVKRAQNLITQSLKSHSNGPNAERLLHNISTTQLKALIALAKTNNFTIASRNQGVSVSSIHRSARDLEHLMPVSMFEKTSFGVALTKPATSLAKAAQLAFQEIQQAYMEIQALHNREVGKFVIGSMPLARTYVLPGVINQITNRYPNFKINIIDGPYEDMLQGLLHGEIDILIGALRHPAPSKDVEQHKLFAAPLCIIVGQHHPLTTEKYISETQLADYAWIVPRSGTPTRTAFEKLFNDADITVPQKLVETGSHNLIRELLLDSDRIAIISEYQMHRELDLDLLVKLPMPIPATDRDIGTTRRTGWQPTRRQQEVLDLIMDTGH
jgi:DNA-binding transcriptional LysR family regulator